MEKGNDAGEAGLSPAEPQRPRWELVRLLLLELGKCICIMRVHRHHPKPPKGLVGSNRKPLYLDPWNQTYVRGQIWDCSLQILR